ncbi:hypothetical protein AMTR_s00019p00245720 [Amborella trichopoda]|uniref:Bifunctional lysine-specific demethylase and histidyl-hydroxylase n=1 Tax=Amborella trichopoda TaxID=13333 RepID=W1PI56_AMBTC|nr:hypothetical protein AMTR_s00019p00245720 [Amborella trichopoda]
MVGGKRKRKRNSSETHISTQNLFPQMLAAYSMIHTEQGLSTLKKVLNFYLRLIRTPPNGSLAPQDILPDGVLSLFPLLLKTRYPDVAVRSVEIVGAVSLWSLEANIKLVSDEEIVNAMVSMLESNKRRVVMAACNAVMDLATTTIGSESLCKSSSIEKILSLFCQELHCSKEFTYCLSWLSGNHCFSEGDSFLVLVLQSLETLIKACDKDRLVKIPKELATSSLDYLKQLLGKLQEGKLQDLPKIETDCPEQKCQPNSKRWSDLAETIFRLSMIHCCFTTYSVDAIKESIFGNTECSFDMFLTNHWEDSPVLLKKKSKASDDYDNIIGSLIQSINSESIETILGSILRGLVPCPPIASDELEILNFLKEVHGSMGGPLIYGQDIRLVKTVKELTSLPDEENLGEEIHFTVELKSSCSIIENTKEVMEHECRDAYYSGYTIALRGVEFRSDKVAAIADNLAVIFGQPSVGANIYLTPPNSQGLLRHYDDHCVFICQLRGSKRWAIFPRTTLLPRLYEPLNTLHVSDSEGCSGKTKEILLKEGDILYIPRGCAHEAQTVMGDPEIVDSPEFSLHLTLGIEVEPPFEWEGFTHVALHYWCQKRERLAPPNVGCQIFLKSMSINLLHVSIRLVGSHDTIFRKACLVSAIPLPSNFDPIVRERENTLSLNPKACFSHLISKIHEECSFTDAIASVKSAIEYPARDSLHWMRWLGHISALTNSKDGTNCNNPLLVFKDLLQMNVSEVAEVEKLFFEAKSDFCSSIIFEDVIENYNVLLDRYRNVRKQYMKGMLSLQRFL